MSNCKHDLRGDSCPYCENKALRKELSKFATSSLTPNKELAATEAKYERLKRCLIHAVPPKAANSAMQPVHWIQFRNEVLNECPGVSLTVWFCEQTDEVVEALKKISKEETYHEYNQHLAAKALAKLKAGRGEK